MNEETKRKISIANKGRVFSPEWKKNLSISHLGKKSPRKGIRTVSEQASKEKRKKYRKEWSIKNKVKIYEDNRKWRLENKARIAYLSRLRYQKDNQKELDRIRLKKYGITGDEFRDIINRQNNKCPICHKDINKNLSVDHNHITGIIRGIICNKCNLAIGNAEDLPDRLRRMADYLEGKI